MDTEDCSELAAAIFQLEPGVGACYFLKTSIKITQSHIKIILLGATYLRLITASVELARCGIGPPLQQVGMVKMSMLHFTELTAFDTVKMCSCKNYLDAEER